MAIPLHNVMEPIAVPYCKRCGHNVVMSRAKMRRTGAMVNIYFCTHCKDSVDVEWKELKEKR